jgi:hypothetical protein
MKPLPDEYPRSISIEWTRPKLYESVFDDGCDHDDSAHLYMILRRYSRATPKAIYIGKTWHQCVRTRLRQKDHRLRYQRFCESYPRQRFYVSHGIVSMDEGRLTQKRVDEIERILIYASSLDHTENRSNIWTHKVSDAYRITNKGSRSSLPQTIFLGIVTS